MPRNAGRPQHHRRRAAIWLPRERVRWISLCVAAGLAFILGLVGWTQYLSESLGQWPLSTRIYLTLQLFTFDGGNLEGTLPLALHVARFLAPISLATAIFAALANIFRRAAAAWRARTVSGHLVVVGLGDRGLLIAQRALQAGMRVVVIDPDESNPLIPAAHRLGVTMVHGDARTRGSLLSAGVHRAERLISVAGQLDTNAGVAQAVLDFQRETTFTYPERFSSFIELSDSSAMHALQSYVEHDRVRRRQEFFNLEDRAGRAIIERHAPFLATSGVDDPPGIVVIGPSQTGLSVLAAAARRWEALRRAPTDATGTPVTRPLPLTLLSAAEPVDEALVRMRLLYPELATDPDDPSPVVDVRAGMLDLSLPGLGLDADLSALTEAGLIVIATDDDALQVRIATTIAARLPGRGAIVVTCRRRQAMVTLLETPTSASNTYPAQRLGAGAPRLSVFVVNEELCSDGQIRRGRLDAMARAMHDGYLRDLSRSRSAEENARNPAFRPWEELPEDLRVQNDAAAQALWEMLTDAGYLVVPRSTQRVPPPPFPPDVLDTLAYREHLRWFRGKHPGVAEPTWEAISAEHRDQTRDQIRRVPEVLAAAGLQLAAPLGGHEPWCMPCRPEGPSNG